MRSFHISPEPIYDITCSIVLFHNDPDELRKAIECFLSCPGNNRLYLVDNSKTDDLRFEYIDPRIEYYFLGKNIGYGSGHNYAIEKIKGKSKYHLVLNPDVEFEPSILLQIFQFMEQRTDIGLVMPKVLYRNGEMQYLCKMLPSPNDLIIRRFVPRRLHFAFKAWMEKYELKHKDYNTIMDIPNLSGCFMYIRNEVFTTVGAFDERYFMYLEDTDLCRRINEKYRTVYYPRVSILHGYSKASYKSFKLTSYHLRSTFKYFNKWGWYSDQKRGLINQVLTNRQFEDMVALEPYTRWWNRYQSMKPKGNGIRPLVKKEAHVYE